MVALVHGTTNMAKTGIVSVKAGKWDYSRWQRKFVGHFKQANVKKAIHQVYADMSEKYVPYDTGALTHSVRVTPNYVQWGKGIPYAHYMYEGIVYGPNIPIFSNGQIIGYWSIPGRPKSPSWTTVHGEWSQKRFVYNKSVHPLAQSHWDLAVYRNEMNGFKLRVTRELKKIANEEGW